MICGVQEKAQYKEAFRGLEDAKAEIERLHAIKAQQQSELASTYAEWRSFVPGAF